MDNLYQLLAQKMDNLPQKHYKFCKYPLKAAPQMHHQNKRPFDFVNKPTIITFYQGVNKITEVIALSALKWIYKYHIMMSNN